MVEINWQIRALAIYLPQFHNIPENDKAWGYRFTEWTNVKKGRPLFKGHYQPHIPHPHIGYYDLLENKVLCNQASMAGEYGIHGFAYYHYWFNGKRLLNKPLDEMLASGKPDFPFCYIWANENWTKRWDGMDEEVIIRQEYSLADDLNHIRFLCEKVFADKRYLKIDGKPVFLVYRTELFPDIKQTTEIWRSEVLKYGFRGIHLIRMENFVTDLDPKIIGFDGALEFAPDFLNKKMKPVQVSTNLVFSYLEACKALATKAKPYLYYHCVFPGWDNTARRRHGSATVFEGSNPEIFKALFRQQVFSTIKKFNRATESFIFINAWNEWGEGCHLEPDQKWGYAYLEACRDVLRKTAVSNNFFEHLDEDAINKFYPMMQRRLFLGQRLKHLITTSRPYRFYKGFHRNKK